MLGKKGSGFWLLIYSAGLLGVLSGLFFLSLNPDNEFNKFQEIFTQGHEEVYGTLRNAEFDVIKSNQEVKYHTFGTTNEFGENGGYAKDNLCDKREGFTVLDFENCNPDLEANYLELFKRNFNAPAVNIAGNSVNGSLGALNYETGMENIKIRYERDNSFNQDTFLDFNFLSGLLDRIKECKVKKQNLNTCTAVEFEQKGEYAFFTIENDKNGLMILEEGIKIKKPAFKFAVENTL